LSNLLKFGAALFKEYGSLLEVSLLLIRALAGFNVALLLIDKFLLTLSLNRAAYKFPY
jgi:hypothetical protein